jgi:hypothetical protein
MVGACDDPAEREADAVAESAERYLARQRSRPMHHAPGSPASRITRSTRALPAGRAAAIPAAFDSINGTRIARSSTAVGSAGGEVDADTEQRIEAARTAGRPLGGEVRSAMEQAIGADFGAVRVHVGVASDELNGRIQAKAFTSGSDVFIRRADYAPDSSTGRRLLAHELAHTVQQGVSPRIQRATHDTHRTRTHRVDASPLTTSRQVVRRSSSTTVEEVAEDKQVFDGDIDYGEFFPVKNNGGSEQLAKLTKTKILRADPSAKSTEVGKLEAPVLVAVLEKNKSWVRVRVSQPKPATGWINTKAALEDRRFDDEPLPDPIMPDTGPTSDHVRQTLLGTCYLLAPLMSLADRDPNFIRQHLFAADPTKVATEYTVCFHRPESHTAKGVVDRVTVSATARTLRGDGLNQRIGSGGAFAWPAIVEKAFLAWPHKDPGNSADSGQAIQSLVYLTGQSYEFGDKTVDNREATRQRVIAFATGNAAGGIVVGTTPAPTQEWIQRCGEQSDTSGREPKLGGIVFGHYYQVVSADEQWITLRNPHGEYSRVKGVVDLTAADSVLDWDEFWIVIGEFGNVIFPEG